MDTRSKNKSVGPIVGTLTVIIVLIVAALYFFASSINRQSALNAPSVASTTAQFGTITNNADDVQSIKNDLSNSVK